MTSLANGQFSLGGRNLAPSS